jgi:biopolymer transport protein ExbB
MRKNFLLKTVFLVVVMAVVSAVIVVTMRSSFGTGSTRIAGTETLFEQFVIGGGAIVWFVLLPMSLVMVYLTAEFSLTIRRKRLLPAGTGGQVVKMIQQFGIGQLGTRIAGQDDLVSVAVIRAVGQGRGDWFRMRSCLVESLQEQASKLLRRIEWLNLIGNVSPMVGLFGTVFGMIKLFNAIVSAGGQPQPAQLAEGISVALVTTFWGLFIAIPALALHGVFRSRIEVLVSDAVTEAEDIMPQIKSILMQKQAESQQGRTAKQPIRELAPRPAGNSSKGRDLCL